MYHCHEHAVLMYLLPRQVPHDEAIAERVMSDTISYQLLDAHVRGGIFMDYLAQSRYPDEDRALRRARPVKFRRSAP